MRVGSPGRHPEILAASTRRRSPLLGEAARAYVATLGMLLFGIALACAPVPPKGFHVAIEKEEAIIIWDAAQKTQHFIRRASFGTQAKDFGFLVPTPSQPELAEADDEAFNDLAVIAIPLPPKSASAPGVPQPLSVKVLATAKVAGFDAAVLEANDAQALDRWLKEHGYVSSPDLMDWFKPYIAGGWKITAFKIARDAQGPGAVAPRAVRMSFRTDRPFFPYREPASQRSDGNAAAQDRLLRIYFLAGTRFAGSIGDGKTWPGKVVWSKEIDEADRTRLLAQVKLAAGAAAGAKWLTAFEDRASPRPGTADLFFSRSEDQSPVDENTPPVQQGSRVGGESPAGGDWIYYLILAVLLAASLWGALKMWRRG